MGEEGCKIIEGRREVLPVGWRGENFVDILGQK